MIRDRILKSNMKLQNENSDDPMSSSHSCSYPRSSESKRTSTSKPSFEIDFDPSAFEAHILNVISIIREDFSSSSHHSSSKYCNNSKVHVPSALNLPTKSLPNLKTTSNHLPHVSSLYYHSPYLKDDYSSSNFATEILESKNKLHSTSSKIIFKKTLEAYKTFSSSYLGVSSCSKSKFEATKHLKSSFRTKSKSTDSSYSYSSKSSSNRILISTSLGSREQFIIFSNSAVRVLIDALLFCLSALKLLHGPFDKGNQEISMSSC